LVHATTHELTELKITWINSVELEKLADRELQEKLANLDGIIVPIGWGERGVEGKIRAIKFSRENNIPYLGLCYGMQLAAVEFARHVVGWKDAHTQEVNPNSSHQVVHMIPEQQRVLDNRAYGGIMRLGAWDCKLVKGTQASELYSGLKMISERHRHRYEFNDEFAEPLEKAGLVISGRSEQENLVEFIELPKERHPFFVATQGHPEYKSRPLRPHPLFTGFIRASQKHNAARHNLLA